MTPQMMISKFQSDFDKLDEDTRESLLKSAAITSAKVSELLSAFGQQRGMTSGWRPEWYNKMIGGSPKSNHIWCKAIDVEDKNLKFGKWCLDNVERLKEIGLYMESLYGVPDQKKYGTHNTPGKDGWVHLQIIAPKSGNIIFIP